MTQELGKKELVIMIAISLTLATFGIWLIMLSAFTEGALKFIEAIAGVVIGFTFIHIFIAAIATLFNK